MERQVNKAFKSQAPLRKTTKAAYAALLRSKATSAQKIKRMFARYTVLKDHFQIRGL